MNNKFKTILVGNGPSAILKNNGYIVDKFNTVIRFNNFTTKGYENFIGTKTDIWAVNIGYLFRKDIFWKESSKQPKTIIFSIYSLKEYENYQDCQSICLKPNESLCNIKIAKWGDSFYNTDLKIWPSTGLLCIMQFKPCYITGFDFFEGEKHHYGDQQCFKTHHSNLLEKSIINDLLKNQEVKIL